VAVGSITVSGTRSTGHRADAAYDRLFDRYLDPFLGEGTLVLVGGAGGIDTLALRWLLRRADVHIQIVVPRTVADQPEAAREAIAEALLQQPDRVALVELRAAVMDRASYHRRNRYMVDRSEMVVGFPFGDDRNSGTWQTLDYAESRRTPYLVVHV
jgi:hypothetical protein